jgi:hypothetical protein
MAGSLWPFVLSIVLGLALPVVAQPVPSAAPVLIVPGQSIGGVTVGRSMASTLARLGSPSEVRELRDGTLYTFPRYGLNVYASGGVIQAISTTNSVLRTAEGIAVGDSIANVRRVYGARFSDAVIEGLLGVAYDQHGIAFGLDGVVVSVIIVYPARVQAAAPAATPAIAPPPSPGSQALPAAAPAPILPPALTSPPAYIDVGLVALPRVDELKPFTPETQYMSVVGFLRYVVYQQTGTWLTHGEATRMLAEQQRTRL